jgi:hypothetical protein
MLWITCSIQAKEKRLFNDAITTISMALQASIPLLLISSGMKIVLLHIFGDARHEFCEHEELLPLSACKLLSII